MHPRKGVKSMKMQSVVPLTMAVILGVLGAEMLAKKTPVGRILGIA